MASAAQLAARQKFINMIHAKKVATTAAPQTSPSGYPMVPMHPQMVNSIKQAPKGQIPPGLAKYIASKKKTKSGKIKPGSKQDKAMEKSQGIKPGSVADKQMEAGKSKKAGYNFSKAQKKLGVVN